MAGGLAVSRQPEVLAGIGFLAIINIAYSVGMIIGPYVGGPLVTLFSLPVALTVCGLGYGAYLLATRGINA